MNICRLSLTVPICNISQAIKNTVFLPAIGKIITPVGGVLPANGGDRVRKCMLRPANACLFPVKCMVRAVKSFERPAKCIAFINNERAVGWSNASDGRSNDADGR
ncbi:hypothetical protein [Marinifilum sp.]|uniref:hypothetical protein n=1 Tax=Marinifilum sp. TaxID=2033137 RepID=UPI003BAC870B